MPSRQRVLALVAHVEQGRILDAIDAFYADDVVMQDNQNAPTVGRAANRAREEQFVGFIREVHENRADLVLVDGDHAVVHWHFAFTGADGKRLRFDQLALQTWRGQGDDARIVHERFVYDPATLTSASDAPGSAPAGSATAGLAA
jgi:ketosteroid isomerase-like protein